jgi:tellurite resistance protein
MDRKDFSDEEWKALQFGPFWAFMAVAAQDGHLDEAEKQAFIAAMADTREMHGWLSKQVMESVATDETAIFAAWQMDDRSPADGFAAIRQILGKVDTDEANRYKGMLVWMAVNVANAAGGWVGGSVSGRERHGIEQVAQMLAFNVGDAMHAADIPSDADSLPR